MSEEKDGWAKFDEIAKDFPKDIFVDKQVTAYEELLKDANELKRRLAEKQAENEALRKEVRHKSAILEQTEFMLLRADEKLESVERSAWDAAREFGPKQSEDYGWRQTSKYETYEDWKALEGKK